MSTPCERSCNLEASRSLRIDRALRYWIAFWANIILSAIYGITGHWIMCLLSIGLSLYWLYQYHTESLEQIDAEFTKRINALYKQHEGIVRTQRGPGRPRKTR